MTFYRQEHSSSEPDPIALIGVGCRLPGKITSTEGLLTALREGRDLITEIPPDRWNVEAYYDPDALAPGKTYVRKGGFVEDVYQFDPGFFGITDTEAVRMDPQQRMLLQTVWHALEDAGQSAEELMNSNTGVFLAMMNTNNYSHLKSVFEGPMGLTAYDAMGDAMSIAAGRISHFLGLEGPCLTLDTACSSSLVALHLARQSILAGDCDLAIVAGVNAILHPAIHIAFSKLGLMSRAGRCATFDESADGYIRGEGCVAVVLRRQSDAIAKGDRIIASIVGTAVNQDGRTPALTAPNGRSQEKVIRNALARTAINPNEIGYVEAHGTGTPVGDPIEMSAIVNVYGPGRSANQPLYVGSVKSNFGHIEAGAGLLGLVKSALSLQHEEIFPSIHFNKLNPSIDLGQAPVKVATERIPWPKNGTPRLAGINSFGYSGTNAHIILQEAPAQENGSIKTTETQNKSLFDKAGELVVISAKSADSLDQLVSEWIDFLETEAPLRDIAFTAAMSRTQLTQRMMVIGKDNDDVRQKLQTWRDGRTPKGLVHGQVFAKIKPKVAFIFTGQGSQYADMGRELYENEPHFAETINRIASLMDSELGAPLLDILFGEKSAEYLENTRYVQPALFAIEYALADLLRYLGIEPSYVIGHSVGEIVAAVVAGALGLEDAARFVVARGRLMGQLPSGGTMLAIAATPEQVQRWVEGKEADVTIATVNGPHAVVVSGRTDAVLSIGEIAQAAGRQVKELEVSHAFHSPLMDPILDELTQVATSMRISPPKIPIVSNTSGDFFGDEIKPEYWSNQVRNAVLFHQGMQKIIDAGCSLILEIGPHPALTPVVATSFDSLALKAMPTLRKDKKDASNLLVALASLYVNGASLKFDRLFSSPVHHRVSLPLYPFHKEKYVIDLEGVLDLPPEAYPLADLPAAEELPELSELHPLLDRVVTRNSRKIIFETTLKTTSPWTDHRVLDSTIFPGAGYIEIVTRGFAAFSGQSWQAVIVKDMAFEQPLQLSYKKEKKVFLTLEQTANGKGDTKFSISGDGGVTYCRGRIAVSKAKQEHVQMKAELSGRESEMKIGVFYGELRSRGLEYGARFANVRELWLGKSGSGEAFGRITNTPMGSEQDPFNNAVVLDACLQVFGAALATLDEMKDQPGAFVPASVQAITFAEDLPAQVWSHVNVVANANGRGALVTVRVLNDAGDVLAKFENMELRRILSLATGKPGANSRASGNQIFKSRAHAADLLRPLSRKERVAFLAKWLIAEIKDTIGQAADGLNLETLPPSTAFLEIGLDSLLVTELQRRIQERLEFRFKPMQGLDYQSIETMAEFIHDEALLADLEGEVTAVAN